jgi:DNA-binding CsgD family transcriptional regulator
MGAVEHLKTLCSLGLPPESAMVAITPLLHEIIPHGWTRAWLFEPDASISSTYSENPDSSAIYRERLWQFMDDPTSFMSLWEAYYRAVGIGWSLHRQGRGWLDSAYYREVEAPLDSCWMLDAMIGDGTRAVAGLTLTRPRTARSFNVDDVQQLDRLRPWLAHAFRPQPPGDICLDDDDSPRPVGPPVRGGQLILTSDETLVFQTTGLEFFLRTLAGEAANYVQRLPVRDHLPTPIRTLCRRIVAAAAGGLGHPPRMQMPCAYGVLTLDAKWLVPAGAIPEDVARDPKGCLIVVTINLHEHPIAYAARVLRASSATPAQVKVGVQLALGKTKPEIAQELGLQPSSIADLTKKLYQRLDIHNSAELGLKLWLNRGHEPATLPS